ncbi:MAG: MFS transporter [Candidatus Omnitrophica bacterium]|nr:MFS transporter [Candidatus Omnitrophota bacterium]
MNQWKKNLYITWLAETICLMGFSFVLPFLPYFIQELGATDRAKAALWAGFLGTATPLMLVISAPFWGTLADRLGRKVMLTRAMFSGCVILALMATVRTPAQLLILRLIQGTLTGTFVAAVALVASQTPPENSGYSLGLMQTAVYVGSSAGPLIGGLASDAWGYRYSFLASSMILGLAGLLILVGVEEKFMPRENGASQNRSNKLTTAQTFPQVNLMILLIVLFFFQLSGTVVSPVMPLFLQEMPAPPRYLASAAGSILAASGLASIVSAIITARISDRTGYEKILFPLLLAAGFFSLIQPLSRTMGQLLFWRVIYGLAAGGVLPLINSLVNLATERDHLGKTFGIVGSISALGSGMGPVLGGTISSLLQVKAPFFFSGFMMILSALFLWAATILSRAKSD